MEKKRKIDWSKSYPIRPKDNHISHVYIKAKKFVPSFEKDPCPPPMSYLLGWEYSRIWQRERDAMIVQRKKDAKPKRIDMDFTWWLAKRSYKASKEC